MNKYVYQSINYEDPDDDQPPKLIENEPVRKNRRKGSKQRRREAEMWRRKEEKQRRREALEWKQHQEILRTLMTIDIFMGTFVTMIILPQ